MDRNKNIRKLADLDLDLDFMAHPTTGDIVKKTGEDAIKRSVRNLIFTNFYDKGFRSYVGCNATRLLFEPINHLTQQFLKDAINEVITNYEPRVSIIDIKVDVNPENNGYDATISYLIISRNLPVTINLFLERIRV